jgi:acetyltransferase-like isoleucine patch superfamily enzyme
MIEPANDVPFRLLRNVRLGDGVIIYSFTNLYDCEIGAETRVGPFVEIQAGVRVGRRCKIQSHSFLCEGVTLEDDVFVGHGVLFINDRNPRATNADGRPARADDWTLLPVTVRRGASIGSGAIVMGGVTIGERALVGAGAVVTRDVAAGAVVAGVPARVRAPRAG